ncbi:prepilin-type N-terminal cleavage/methylation domain-containing protein [Deinococcus deserti]
MVELLVGLGLIGVVLTALNSLTISSMQASGLLTARSRLQSDAVIANQLIAARLKESCAVYPQNASLTYPAIAGTVHGGSRTWQVGADPFVAFVIPEDSGTRFIAYHLLTAAEYNAQMPAEQQLPAVEESNRVLMEYSVSLPTGTCAAPPAGPPSGGNAALVTDHVRQPTATEPLFVVQDDLSVTVRLRYATGNGAQVVLPALSRGPYLLELMGRNLPLSD